ncbi:MAG TPA: TetR/AcrR family transcriptional regulator [Saprospiraceae bacterium]|nr:TetR/AcrR family transcriptional regulator [Saprospiraceae bacterium]
MNKTKEQIILEVARVQFVKNGYAATRTEEIAQEAGVTKAMVHYYFRTKERLFDEIVRHIFANSLSKLAKSINQKLPIWEKIELIVDSYIEILLKEPDIPFFIMYELSQKRESFVAELQKRRDQLPDIAGFLSQIQEEIDQENWHPMPAPQILLNIMSMTIFPFIAKPIFNTVLELPEPVFEQMMRERKPFIMSFLKQALIRT